MGKLTGGTLYGLLLASNLTVAAGAWKASAACLCTSSYECGLSRGQL